MYTSGGIRICGEVQSVQDNPISTSPAPSIAVETDGLTKRFDGKLAVDSLSLQVRQGQIFGLIGPNGAGKSTFVRMLTTLLQPTAGTARVAGYDIRLRPQQVRRRIGYVPQLLSADPSLTGWENLVLSGHLYAMALGTLASRVREALRFMGLEDAAHALVKTYSGGMIRRLELAQAMLHRPAVLFLDEPTIGLDPVARHAVWERLQELRQGERMAILITTHDMEEADQLCDEIALMDHGRVAVQGSPQRLKADVGPHATLDDVFAHYCGGSMQQPGEFRDVQQTRRATIRHG